VRRIPATALVLGAAFSIQGGAAIAKGLFPELGPPGVVWLRLLFGAASLWVLQRPNLRDRPPGALPLAAALGVTLVCMNLAFYEALDRIPLGVAVTVEFIGPLGVAIAGSRRALDILWVALAGTGIALLAETQGSIEPLGIALAGIAGAFWAAYIVLGTRVGRVWSGSRGLAVAMVVGTVLAAPWGIASAGSNLAEPSLLAQGLAVGVLSSALPLSMEMGAMRRLPTYTFGVLLSLEPAVAALCGYLFLDETLGARTIFAIALVVVASAGAQRLSPPPIPPDAP
jgi:inner membrane transporter RhtA